MEGYQQGVGRVENEGKVQGIRSINGRHKVDGEGKNSMGNEEAKELICRTHGHKVRWGMMVKGEMQGGGE